MLHVTFLALLRALEVNTDNVTLIIFVIIIIIIIIIIK